MDRCISEAFKKNCSSIVVPEPDNKVTVLHKTITATQMYTQTDAGDRAALCSSWGRGHCENNDVTCSTVFGECYN